MNSGKICFFIRVIRLILVIDLEIVSSLQNYIIPHNRQLPKLRHFFSKSPVIKLPSVCLSNAEDKSWVKKSCIVRFDYDTTSFCLVFP